MVGITRESLSRINGGTNTSLDTVQKIANALNVHISELFAKKDGIVIAVTKDGVRYDLTPYDLRRAIEIKESQE